MANLKYFGDKVRRGKGRCSELEDVESWDIPEMTDVAGRDGVASLQGASTDEKVIEGDIHSFGRRFSPDLANQFGRCVRDWIDWQGCFQLQTPTKYSSTIGK